MPKVEDSNPAASILKFGLFLFLKCLPLDMNNNLGISVALLVLYDFTSVKAKAYYTLCCCMTVSAAPGYLNTHTPTKRARTHMSVLV